MPSPRFNPFLTSNRPCMCSSGRATKDCCALTRSAYFGEAEALRNIGPPLPPVNSYAAFLATIITLYLREMFPADAASIKVILVNMDDTNFRSRAIVAREDGQFGRPLFQGSEGHASPEASAEDLLFLIIKDIARTKGCPQPTKEEFDARIKESWEGVQEDSRRESGAIAWLEYQVRIQYRQGR